MNPEITAGLVIFSSQRSSLRWLEIIFFSIFISIFIIKNCRYDGTWEFVECPTNFATGTPNLRIKEGSSKWWYAFQPTNFREGIASVSVNISGNEILMDDSGTNGIDGFWFQKHVPLEFPVTVTVTNLSGATATVTLQEGDISNDNEITMTGSI